MVFRLERFLLECEPDVSVERVGFRVWGLGFRVSDLGFRVYGSGFRVQGSGFII